MKLRVEPTTPCVTGNTMPISAAAALWWIELRVAAEDAVLEAGRENVDVRADGDDDVGLRHARLALE